MHLKPLILSDRLSLLWGVLPSRFLRLSLFRFLLHQTRSILEHSLSQQHILHSSLRRVRFPLDKTAILDYRFLQLDSVATIPTIRPLTLARKDFAMLQHRTLDLTRSTSNLTSRLLPFRTTLARVSIRPRHHSAHSTVNHGRTQLRRRRRRERGNVLAVFAR